METPCPAVYDPVIGSDGLVYDNACFANAAGVTVVRSGVAGLGAITADPMMSVMTAIYKVGSLAGGVVGAYHGYKRHRGSIGWAIGWSLLGGLFWPIALPVAYAQGVGKPMR